jgi:hypothetical protein
MDAGSVYGVNCFDARQNGRDNGTCEFVYQLTKSRVFLRWPPNNGEGPYSVIAMVDGFHLEHWKVVLFSIIAEVVTEWAFR